MMFERFTADGRQIVIRSQDHARRLGHSYIGCEHLLLSAASLPVPAGEVLREHGVTPERVEAEIVRMTGYDRRVASLGGLDREALAAIGIDLDVVRERIEATFGPDALARATLAMRRSRRGGLRSRLRRPARNVRQLPTVSRNAELMDVAGAPRGHIPFTSRAKKSLELSLREALARKDNYIGPEHVVLALISMDSSAVPVILAAIGVPAAALRTAVTDRYRKAS
jgi:ATP-dependent Clp protease ATP-binding subunit ClpA